MSVVVDEANRQGRDPPQTAVNRPCSESGVLTQQLNYTVDRDQRWGRKKQAIGKGRICAHNLHNQISAPECRVADNTYGGPLPPCARLRNRTAEEPVADTMADTDKDTELQLIAAARQAAVTAERLSKWEGSLGEVSRGAVRNARTDIREAIERLQNFELLLSCWLAT